MCVYHWSSIQLHYIISHDITPQEKHSAQNCNVSCILTMPQYMNHGYGKMMIDFSEWGGGVRVGEEVS